MKSLMASIIIFALVILTLFVTGAWISQKSETLHAALCHLPGQPDKKSGLRKIIEGRNGLLS